MKIRLETIPHFLFDLRAGDRIFLKGKLGAGKTTFSQALIRHFLWDQKIEITSPTYTYYHEYPHNLYHFDLYRIEHFDDITRIGATEIFDDPESICIIEWPEILGTSIIPTKIIEMTETESWREIAIFDCQAWQIDK